MSGRPSPADDLLGRPSAAPSSWSLRIRGGPAAVDAAPGVWECYRQVFPCTAEIDTWRSEQFDRHAARDGHRLVTAHDGSTVVGFAWGYVGQRGQYWSDLVVAALPSPLADEWVGGHFEVAELGVLPAWRGLGIGSALLDALLQGRAGRSLLSTKDDPSDSAVRLYLGTGWQRLGLLSPGVQLLGLTRP